MERLSHGRTSRNALQLAFGAAVRENTGFRQEASAMQLASPVALTFLVVFLPCWAMASAAAADANYDERKVPPYTLPDPLASAAGESIATAEAWRSKRRPELLALFAEQMYGKAPDKPRQMNFRVLAEDADLFDALATRLDVELEIEAAQRGAALRFTVLLPNRAQRPVPVFLGVLLFDTQKPLPEPAVPVELRGQPKPSASQVSRVGQETAKEILRRGYAIVTLDIEHLCPDSAAEFRRGIYRLHAPGAEGPPGPTEYGALAAWAWGLSRALDYVGTRPELDARRAIAIGHSRRGKAALWAAAQDERFAAVVSNNSGCGGAALSKRVFGETVAIINRSFPHWFCGNFKYYNDREPELPIDQHELIALAAPRGVYVASAEDDAWADPKGEFLAALGAEPVYRLLGAPGLGTSEMPAVDRPVGERLRYHVRRGQHALADYDWRQYLDYADRLFGRAADEKARRGAPKADGTGR